MKAKQSEMIENIDYDDLAKRLNESKIIPVLGAGVLHLSNPSPLTMKELLEKLPNDVHCSESPLSLPMILQYCQIMDQKHGRKTPIRNIRDAEGQGFYPQTNPLYKLFSKIEKSIILISTCYDGLLEKAFLKEKKAFVIISHQIGLESANFRKIILEYSDESASEIIFPPDKISEKDLLKDGYSLIYRIFGCFNLYSGRNDNTADPFIRQEYHFINFLSELKKIIPNYLVKQFSQKELLFLGYELEQWQDQSIATAILERKLAKKHSYMVRENLKSRWKPEGVDIYYTDLRDFVNHLCKAMRVNPDFWPDIQAPEFSSETPSNNSSTEPDKQFDVFLCHNSEDKSSVKKIGEELKEAELRPWLDEWELPPGVDWTTFLEEQIMSIRTAAVFVGKHGIGPWQNMEMRAFIREFVKRKCPVIPVILSDCEKVPELPLFLGCITYVDFRKKHPNPMKQLIWGITGKKDKS